MAVGRKQKGGLSFHKRPPHYQITSLEVSVLWKWIAARYSTNEWFQPHVPPLCGYTGNIKSQAPCTSGYCFECSVLRFYTPWIMSTKWWERQNGLPVSSFPFSLIVSLKTQTNTFHNYRLAPATTWVCLRTIRPSHSVLGCTWQYKILKTITL